MGCTDPLYEKINLKDKYMKLRNLWLAVAASAIFAACTTENLGVNGEEGNSLPVAIAADVKTIEAHFTGELRTVTITSTRAWTATCPDWVVLSDVSSDKEIFAIVLAVTENDGDARNGVVLFTAEGGETASVSISQNCEYGPRAGGGTEASPYNVSGARAAGTGADVYISASVLADPVYDLSAGTATYTIVDDGYEGDISVENGYYFDGEVFCDGDELSAGDIVLVYGSLSDNKLTGSKLLKINGKGRANEFFVDTTPVEIKAYETSVTIAVESNVDWTVSSENPEVTFDKTTGSGDGVVTVTLPENTNTSPAVTYVKISTDAVVETGNSYIVAITQEASSGTPRGYYEVTENNADWTGKYLVVYAPDGLDVNKTGRIFKAQTCGLDNTANKGQFNSDNAADITFTDKGFISINDQYAGEYIEVTKAEGDNMYYITATAYDKDESDNYTVASPRYLYQNEGNAGLHNSKDPVACKIVWNETEGMKIWGRINSSKDMFLMYRAGSYQKFSFGSAAGTASMNLVKFLKYQE